MSPDPWLTVPDRDPLVMLGMHRDGTKITYGTELLNL